MKPKSFEVLIVEDDKEMELMVCEFLSRKGYKCTSRPLARQAIKDIKSGNLSPDLILSDINMPQMTGYEFVNELRTLGIHTPVILMTAYGSDQEYRRAKEAGADSYLPKPFALLDLVSEIKKFLGEAA